MSDFCSCECWYRSWRFDLFIKADTRGRKRKSVSSLERISLLCGLLLSYCVLPFVLWNTVLFF